MKRLLLSLTLAAAWFTPAGVQADDAALLAGKWSVKKTSEQGQSYTQTIEVKKDKFVFEILGDGDRVALHAEGDMKLETLGPFNSARFLHIRAGDSAANLREVDEEYAVVYLLDGDTWTTASNFDKSRQQKPSVEVYRRAATPPEAKPKS